MNGFLVASTTLQYYEKRFFSVGVNDRVSSCHLLKSFSLVDKVLLPLFKDSIFISCLCCIVKFVVPEAKTHPQCNAITSFSHTALY